MAYDALRARTVLFGGAPGPRSDTWEYDGTTWTQRITATIPPARYLTEMTYDVTAGRVVLVGGAGGAGPLDDTWALDGVDWTLINPAVLAPARYLLGLTYDVGRQRVVTFGGGLAETWTLGYTMLSSGEACAAGIDSDGDAAIGCADDECWPVCAPTCPPVASSCATAPACGDLVCDPIEDCRSCPADCAQGTATCLARCGDTFCDAVETIASCPGDCTPG